MVTLDELAAAVSTMRKAQKDYFRSRTDSRLKEAKAAEVAVDKMLLLLAPTNVAVRANLAQQANLFE